MNPRAQLSSCIESHQQRCYHESPSPALSPPSANIESGISNIGIIRMAIFPGCSLLACNMNRQLAHTMADLADE
ncbi:hypothetical protein BCR42DRAFT_430651, partial [Absidia repens]